MVALESHMHVSADHPIAYFCAEFGFDHRLPLYAGGLGVLAGDTLKAAADAHVPMVGIGLLYRGDKARQEIDQQGMQQDRDHLYDPLTEGLEHVYLDEQPLFVYVNMSEVTIWARVWKKTFGDTVTLYLLDADTDQNQLSERSITHALYHGSEESQLKQQLLLGIGGIKLLRLLGIRPAVYHLNEGRPAFLYWKLTRQIMEEQGLDYVTAAERAKAMVVYTNHTLVAAGNNSVDVGLLSRFARHYAEELGLSMPELMQAGAEGAITDRFFMTRFALNSSRRANGVSSLHSQLSAQTWPGFNWTNITNGVHMPTWQSPAVSGLLAEVDNHASKLDMARLWQAHQTDKQRLADFILQRTGFGYDPNWLVITWSRRLAGYKRLADVFADVERLRQILRTAGRPVKLLVAGKAHTLDQAGKAMLQNIIKHMSTELAGHALFIPNYDLEVASYLVRGSDVWLNIPEYGKEACGTSGMKAASNGVLQCTVADGWAQEVAWEGIGWQLPSENVSQEVYHTLESQIIPLFYTRNEQGLPLEWLQRMKKTIAIAPQYSAERMLQDYQTKLYDAG